MTRTAILLLILALSGCQTTELPDAPILPGQSVDLPPLTVIYHPYGPALNRSISEPMPPFSGLTDRRIDVDRRHMLSAGISGIIIRIDPETARDAQRRVRIQALTKAMAGGNQPLRTTIQMDMAGLTGDQLATVIRELRSQSLHTHPGYRRVGGEPLVEYRGNLPADYDTVPGIALRPAPAPTRSLPEGIAENPTTKTTFMVVCRRVGDSWEPNRHPRPFSRRLKTAAQLNNNEIRLDSWNDFATGAFLQPSVDYQRDLLDALIELK